MQGSPGLQRQRVSQQRTENHARTKERKMRGWERENIYRQFFPSFPDRFRFAAIRVHLQSRNEYGTDSYFVDEDRHSVTRGVSFAFQHGWLRFSIQQLARFNSNSIESVVRLPNRGENIRSGEKEKRKKNSGTHVLIGESRNRSFLFRNRYPFTRARTLSVHVPYPLALSLFCFEIFFFHLPLLSFSFVSDRKIVNFCFRWLPLWFCLTVYNIFQTCYISCDEESARNKYVCPCNVVLLEIIDRKMWKVTKVRNKEGANNFPFG